jgi:hypothetical protein
MQVHRKGASDDDMKLWKPAFIHETKSCSVILGRKTQCRSRKKHVSSTLIFDCSCAGKKHAPNRNQISQLVANAWMVKLDAIDEKPAEKNDQIQDGQWKSLGLEAAVHQEF